MASGMKSQDLGFRARTIVDFCERIGPQYVRDSWYFYKGVGTNDEHYGQVQEILKEFFRRGLSPKGERL